jgi:hypothetical protein
MFNGITSGYKLISESIQIFLKHPKMMLPLLAVWFLYAPTIIIVRHHIPWEQYDSSIIILASFGIILFLSLLLTLSCGMTAEIIKQIETGQKTSYLKAFSEFLSRSFYSLLPLAFCWAVVWFILVILNALISKKKSQDGDRSEGSWSEGAVRDLNESTTSWSFKLMQKQIRMIVFLVVPAIVWDNLNFFSSISKTKKIMKTHFVTFQTGFVLSTGVAGIVFSPISLMLILTRSKSGPPLVTFSENTWTIALIYTALAWSYTILVEQLFCAELYLWNHKWERKLEELPLEERKNLKLHDVARPSILDEIADLEMKSSSTKRTESRR